MKKLLLIVCVQLCSTVLWAQCDCEQEFKKLKSRVEESFAGFHDYVTPATQAAYEEHNRATEAMIKNVQQYPYCTYYLQKWTTFFDGNVAYNRQSATVDVLGEMVLTTAQLQALRDKDANSIEGIYNMGSHHLAVVEHPTPFGKYAVVLLDFVRSKRPVAPGSIVMLLKDTVNGYIEGLSAFLHEQRVYGKVEPGKFILQLTRDGVPFAEAMPGKEYFQGDTAIVQQLSPKTVYFAYNFIEYDRTTKLDNLMKEQWSTISQAENLIFDMRKSAYGLSLWHLVPVMADHDVVKYGSDLYASPATRTYVQAAKYKQRFTNKGIADAGNYITKANNNAWWIPADAKEVYHPVKSPVQLKHVVILVNEVNDLTARFLDVIRQSNLVTIIAAKPIPLAQYNLNGQFLLSKDAYANIYMARQTNTTVQNGILQKFITPTITLSPKEDWIKLAQQYVESLPRLQK